MAQAAMAQAGFGPDLTPMFYGLTAMGMGGVGVIFGVIGLIIAVSKRNPNNASFVISTISLAFWGGAIIYWLLAAPNIPTIFPIVVVLLGTAPSVWVISWWFRNLENDPEIRI